MVDDVLKSMNIPARRLNSYFVTSDHEFAWQFGEVYHIFPYDDFHYTWCQNYKDVIIKPGSAFIHNWLKFTSEFEIELKKLRNSMPNQAETIDFILTLWDNSPSSVYSKILYNQELHSHFYPINKWVKIDGPKLIDRLGISSDQGLSQALEQGNEIWMTGSYLAVHESLSFAIYRDLEIL